MLIFFYIFCQICMHLLLATIVLLHKLQLQFFDISTKTRMSIFLIEKFLIVVAELKYHVILELKTFLMHVSMIFRAYFSAY